MIKKQKGFSLLEVMFAVAIISMSLGVLFAFFSHLVSITGRSKQDLINYTERFLVCNGVNGELSKALKNKKDTILLIPEYKIQNIKSISSKDGILKQILFKNEVLQIYIDKEAQYKISDEHDEKKQPL